MKQTPPPDRNLKAPRLQAPEGSCDCHFHIIGPQDIFPMSDERGLDAQDCTLEDLVELHDTMGISRGVIISTMLYGDNSDCIVDALGRYPDRFRAIGSPPLDSSDDEIQALTDAGMVGVRFSYARSPVIDMEQIARLKEFGWHPQFWFEGAGHMLDWKDKMMAIEGNYVIDHMGWQPADKGIDRPGFRAVLDCVDRGNCWVKISGPMRFSAEDRLPYVDAAPFAQALVERAPERIIWGTDWPHPNYWGQMPNDADLLDLLLDWVPDEQTRHRILVDNPAALFGF